MINFLVDLIVGPGALVVAGLLGLYVLTSLDDDPQIVVPAAVLAVVCLVFAILHGNVIWWMIGIIWGVITVPWVIGILVIGGAIKLFLWWDDHRNERRIAATRRDRC